VICDMLDGRLARMTNTASEMGMQLDSLSDVISFGVAPAILINFWVFQQISPPGWIAPFGMLTSFIFVICGAMRLARFNVMARDTRILSACPFRPRGLHRRAGPFPEGSSIHIDRSGTHAGARLCVVLPDDQHPEISRIQESAAGKGRSINVLFLAIIVAGIYFYSEMVLIVLATVYALAGPALKLYSWIRPRPAQPVAPPVQP